MIKPIKDFSVLLAEDDSLMAEIIAFIMTEMGYRVVTVNDGAKALKAFRAEPADLVILDINMPVMNGLDALRQILREDADAKVIMLTSLADEFVITQSYTAGAVNYLEKTRFKELPAAIRSAVLHPGTMEVLLKEFARLKREEQLRGLTPAEREVFELLDEGYSHSQMEKKLFKTESTLKNQINKILKKLGVKSSREAVEKVRRKGIVRQKDKS
ncbi:MAG: response regulator transcription factor [Rhodospirillaceae bacterium]|nr:response regulator transcription factor [Rhodospirillaceae bacterium]